MVELEGVSVEVGDLCAGGGEEGGAGGQVPLAAWAGGEDEVAAAAGQEGHAVGDGADGEETGAGGDWREVAELPFAAAGEHVAVGEA